MKFSASFSDQGSIETFTRCVQAMARMSKHKFIIRMTTMGLCLITCPATGLAQRDGIEYWIGVLFGWSPTFQTHTFSGLSEDKNEIVIDVNAGDFLNCLAGNHANTKLRLSNRDNKPHLRIEIRSHGVSHELPVNVIQSKKWETYNRPNCEGERAIIALPPAKTIHRVLTSLKNIQSKFVTLKVSSVGDLQMQSNMKYGDVNVFFSDLVNEQIGEGDAENQDQPAWSSVKLHVKPLHQFITNFAFAHGKMKLTVLTERAAEFSLVQDDLEVSFVLGDTAE